MSKQIFDVVFHPPKQRTVRLLAEDENDAGHIAMSFFECGTTVKKPDKKKRVVYEWRGHEGVVPVTRKRGVK